MPLPLLSQEDGTIRSSLSFRNMSNEVYRFLLKYASRDEVEILSKGNGGITEMRNAVAAYEETNPLYGYLKYRRRNVLVKYLPEDCSRLIQGRSYCIWTVRGDMD